MSFVPSRDLPPEPTDRPLKLGDAIYANIPLWIVAKGLGVGQIGTQEALSKVPGRTLLAEGSVYDKLEFPDLARFLAPMYGERQVPMFSRPVWI